MKRNSTRILLLIAALLIILILGSFIYLQINNQMVQSSNDKTIQTQPLASTSSLPTNATDMNSAETSNEEKTVTLEPSSTVQPMVTSTPKSTISSTPAVMPTPTPTALPQISFQLSDTAVTSTGGSEILIKVTCDSDVSITTSCSSGISTWYDPGALYIYPKNEGTVTVTASKGGYQSAYQIITVAYVVPTPTPTSTPAADTSSSDDTVLTPTLTKDDDLSFWFRGCMVDAKDDFFNAAASYGVDPWLAIAIADHETGYGSSSACNDYNNVAGIITNEDGLKHYNSLQDGINDLMYLLQYYNSKGRTTIPQIAAWYCNGEQTWIDRVTTIYNSFQK